MEATMNKEADIFKKNTQIHELFVRQDYEECINIINIVLNDFPTCEYAIYVKGLILRKQGKIQDSLKCFEKVVRLDPTNPSHLKQIGRTMFLLGKADESLEFYEEALKYGEDDWEIWYNKGMCNLQKGNHEAAEECFIRSNSIVKQDATYFELGKLFVMQEKYEDAVEVYLEGLDFSPENPELLTTLGLLYLRLGDNTKAFDALGKALSLDPKNPKTILAAGSIIQDGGEMDVALSKYKIAAKKIPNSAQLWSNIGMCFLGNKNYVAAIACLKKALYFEPFEWIIAYNLGLAHLNAKQYASAFHYFSSVINSKPDFASAYMYLGVTLSNLDDFDNAVSAYERALELEKDFLYELNYAITLQKHGEIALSQQHFDEFKKLFSALSPEEQKSDPQILKKSEELSGALKQKSK